MKCQHTLIIFTTIEKCDKEELIQDLIVIIASFVARYYGQRRARRKTEAIIKELQNDNGHAG